MIMKKWSVQISKEVAKKLKGYCKESGCTMNAVVERGVLFCINNRDITSLDFKTENKFICSFLKSKISPPSFVIKRVTRPRFTIDRETKETCWEPVVICLYDTISPNVSKIINDIILSENKFDLEIKTLKSTGETIEKWMIKNGCITMADFGTLNWESNRVVEINLCIEYDSAELVL